MDGVVALAVSGLPARELPRLAITGGLLGDAGPTDAVACEEESAATLSTLLL